MRVKMMKNSNPFDLAEDINLWIRKLEEMQGIKNQEIVEKYHANDRISIATHNYAINDIKYSSREQDCSALIMYYTSWEE